MGGGEKTEQATAKRRKDEREKGNVFKSQEIITLFSLLAVIFTIQTVGAQILKAMGDGFDHFWGLAATKTTLESGDLTTLFYDGAIFYITAAFFPMLAAILAATLVTLAQTRGLFNMKQLRPKFSKLNPISGIKKLFSMRGAIELIKSLLKISILSYVIYSKFAEHFGEFPRLMEMEFGQVLAFGSALLMDIVTNVAVLFAFLAAIDFMYQRWQYEKDLRMSKHEIKEEYKQTEGDPQIKNKIRQKQREMAMGRMMENVPSADVVIKNPTHYAVAIRYEAGKNRSPVVLAKGADYVALRIIRTAEENDVPIMENKPLARGLYENVPLDREIPEEFFQPVAEVLAFVYSTQKTKKAKDVKKAKTNPPPDHPNGPSQSRSRI